MKFDEDTLNTFLKTLVIIKDRDTLLAYSRFALLRPDPQDLATKLCIPGRGFKLNVDGQPLKILRKNMTTLLTSHWIETVWLEHVNLTRQRTKARGSVFSREGVAGKWRQGSLGQTSEGGTR